MRMLSAIVSATCAAMPLAGWSLGLGPLQQQSSLNEPFVGRIEIVDARSDDFDSLKIGIAPIDRFENAGIPVNNAVLGLKFTVKNRGRGSRYVEVTSNQPIREPILNFLVSATWERGQLFRELHSSFRSAGLRPSAATGGCPDRGAVKRRL